MARKRSPLPRKTVARKRSPCVPIRSQHAHQPEECDSGEGQRAHGETNGLYTLGKPYVLGFLGLSEMETRIKTKQMTSNETKPLYEFGPYRLDPGRKLLLRNGDLVAVTSKALEILLVLVERSEHVVTGSRT